MVLGKKAKPKANQVVVPARKRGPGTSGRCARLGLHLSNSRQKGDPTNTIPIIDPEGLTSAIAENTQDLRQWEEWQG